MNIVLVGKTGSGKSSVASYLSEYLRYDKAITCTTRKPRIGEVNGVDYNFLTEKEFKWKNLILKTIIYGDMYGMEENELKKSENLVLVVNPDGLKELKAVKGFNFVSILIECENHKRYSRCVRRGNSPIYILSRMAYENDYFGEVETDYICKNETDDVWDCVISVLECVKDFVRR